MTQAAFAEAVGWSRSTLASVEKGHDAPSREFIAALATYAGVSVDWLLNGTPEAKTPREAALLDAFRKLPPAEQDALLTLAVRRAEPAQQ